MAANRITNFKKDNAEYGKIGETDLLSILTSSDKTQKVIDCSDKEEYRDDDIDIIQYRKDGSCVSYEVKTDTQGVYTRNIAFEVFSNGNPGCLLRSKADYVYYTFLKRDSYEIEERYLINLKELKKYIMRNFDLLARKGSGLTPKYMPRGEDNTALILINIEKLLNDIPLYVRKISEAKSKVAND